MGDAAAPMVKWGAMPRWFVRALRAAMKRDGEPMRQHESPWYAMQRMAPSGLLDHDGTSKIDGVPVFVTEPYGDHDAPAAAFAAWIGCDLVKRPVSFHNPGNCERYEFHERRAT